MFLFLLTSRLRLPFLVKEASPCSRRRLQSSFDSQYANKVIEGVGAGFGTRLFH